MRKLIFIFAFIPTGALACEIPAPRFSTENCPITPDHVEMVADYYRCQRKKASAQRRKSRTNVDNPILHQDCGSIARQENPRVPSPIFFLPAAMAARMTPAERRTAIGAFFDQNQQRIQNQIAETNYSADMRQPANPPGWPPGDMTQEEFDALPEKRRQARSSLRLLQNEHNALQIAARGTRNENHPIHRKLESFEKRYQHYIAAAERNGGQWARIHEPNVLKLQISASEVRMVDIANTPFEDLPPKVMITRPDGVRVDLKGLYTEPATKQYAELRTHFLNGGRFDNIPNSPGSDVNRSNILRTLRQSGADYRTRAALSGASVPNKTQTTNLPDRDPKTGRLRAVRFAGGLLLLAGLVVEGAMLHVSREQECDRAFPFYPTDRQRSHVTGMPLSSKCGMEIPTTGKMPKEIQQFNAMTYAEQDELLNLTSANRSPCGYYRQAYNKLFCSSSETGGNTEAAEK